MLRHIDQTGDIRILELNTRRLSSDIGRFMSAEHLAKACDPGQAALVDLSRATRLEHSGLAVLLTASQGSVPVGFFGLSEPLSAKVSRMGFDNVLTVFANRQAAMSSDWARKYRLAGRRAVILSAGKGTRCAPLTRDVPKPMLDILGKPVIERLVDHLSGFGIRDYLLNPGHLGPVINTHFGDGHRFGVHVAYLNEGRTGPDGWEAAPLGSASSLARLAHGHSAFERDTFVLCGDALTDLDMAAMMDHHLASGAMATIAAQHVAPELVSKYGIIVADESGRVASFQEKPERNAARSRLANTGIYIFSPDALCLLPDVPNLDIAKDLLPAILRIGGGISVFAPKFQWTDIGCARDYFGALVAAIGDPKMRGHDAQEIAPNLFAAPGAQVAARAQISGPVWVESGARIAPGAKIDGPAFIGAGAVVEPRSLLRNSALMPGTHMARGAAVVDTIAAGNWAVCHPLADGSRVASPPLDLVSSVETQAVVRAPRNRGHFAMLRAAG